MQQPNILVICSDEHNPLFTGYRKHPFVKTPNLDRLASEGSYFTNAYCNSPVCTPSRMSFITGKYVHQIGSWFLGCPLDQNEMTWARRLHEAGIPSTMFGKMDFCGEYQDGGFSDYKIIDRRGAWDPYPRTSPLPSRLTGYIRKDKKFHIDHAGIREDIITDGSRGIEERFGYYDHDRIVTDWTVEYLKEKGSSNQKKPWACYTGLIFPHWPFTVPQEYFNMYYPDKVEMPNDAKFPNESLHPEVYHFQKSLGLGEITEEMLGKVIATYCGMITAMDAMVGRILEELKNQGFADNTYIIYTSDHGDMLGEHGLFYKQCSYEGSVGVPLIVKGPSVAAGKRFDQPVSLVDMYPTIMDMANLESESDRPGKSWLPLLRGDKCEGEEYAFSEYHGNFFRQDWYMLVKDNYKYTYYVNERPSLFNLKQDPHENIDLALKPEYSEILDEFKELLKTIVDPEKVSLCSKKDLGLIGTDNEDFTRTLTYEELQEGILNGRFKLEPEWGQKR